MTFNNEPMELSYFLWPVFGVVVVVIAVVFRKKIRNALNVSADIEKLGLKVLGLDGYGLLLIIGVLFMAFGPFMQWSDGKGKIADLEARVAVMDEQLQSMKEYDFAFKLNFPKTDTLSESPNIGVFLKKKGTRQFSIYEGFETNPTSDALTVQVKSLKQGDLIYFVVGEDRKSWKSEIVQIPTGSMAMKRNALP